MGAPCLASFARHGILRDMRLCDTWDPRGAPKQETRSITERVKSPEKLFSYDPFEHIDREVLSWKLSHPCSDVLDGAPKYVRNTRSCRL